MGKKNYVMRYWLVGNVVLAYFPFYAIIIMSLITASGIDVHRMIGDGELVLCSFLIIVPSLISNYRSQQVESRKTNRELLFFMLLFMAFMLLISYTSIKMSDTAPYISYIVSFMSVILSLCISWGNESYLQEVDSSEPE